MPVGRIAFFDGPRFSQEVDVKLYYLSLSGHSHRARLFLSILGADVEQIELGGGDLRTAEFLRMNPFGQVPVLVDGDKRRWPAVLVKYCRVGTLSSISWKDVVCPHDRPDAPPTIKPTGRPPFVICAAQCWPPVLCQLRSPPGAPVALHSVIWPERDSPAIVGS